jgi:ribosomal subunit interface protein
MKFKFNFHQVDSSQALAAYCQEEFERIGRFLLNDSTWQVVFRFGRYDCQVQADVNSPWGHFKATGKSDNFYRAVDEVADKLGKQFRKYKDRHQNHKKFDRSKRGKLRRLNAQLEYDNTPYFKKSA